MTHITTNFRVEGRQVHLHMVIDQTTRFVASFWIAPLEGETQYELRCVVQTMVREFSNINRQLDFIQVTHGCVNVTPVDKERWIIFHDGQWHQNRDAFVNTVADAISSYTEFYEVPEL